MSLKHNATTQIYSPADAYVAQPDKSHPEQQLTLRTVTTGYARLFVLFYMVSYLALGVMFMYVLISSYVLQDKSVPVLLATTVGFGALVAIELLRLFQGFTIPYFALRAKDPVYLEPESGLRVALLTTIVPAKEPLDIAERTLRAMKHVRYDGKVDVWILDEGNDPRVKTMAAALGVRHFSRHNIDKYNQPDGAFKARSKAGNHNAWRAEHENAYDIVAQMDPDHVPFPNFLERILGYFRDETVGFVVAPQVYGNQHESFIARAAAEQAYIFHGIIQRAGNSSYTPLLIETNHAYRPAAWKQIGGYQDSIIEDHLTSIALHSTNVGESTLKWKGIYTPDIVSVGEGPTTWTDYFNQQKRWAYGVWEIVTQHNSRYFSGLTLAQKVHYAALQSFYPSISMSWVLSLMVSVVTLILGINFLSVDLKTFMSLWLASVMLQLLFSVWVMRYNLNEHERRSTGLSATALTLLVAPVYSAAAISALMRQKLSYAVTAKGDLRTIDTLSTYAAHFAFLLCYIPITLVAVLTHREDYMSFYWSVFTIAVLLPLPIYFAMKQFEHSLRKRFGTISSNAH
jgi:cellulose synthase (UDP-forming)